VDPGPAIPLAWITCLREFSQETDENGEAIFEIETNWRVYQITVDEQWVYRISGTCDGFHPMRTQEEIDDGITAPALPPLTRSALGSIQRTHRPLTPGAMPLVGCVHARASETERTLRE
jgi:hypothetical protein